MNLNIIICGVGGQGNLLASVAIANYAMKKGFNVVGTETIGAAQRGGSVVSHLRISDGPIYASTVPDGTADILLGFEPVEALRHIKKLNPEGIYIINVEKVPTVLCNMGLDQYPDLEQIMAALQDVSSHGYAINAAEKARELGGAIMTNVVLLGALSSVSDFFDRDEFIEVLKKIISPKVLEKNLKAFEEGRALIAS
ncbi:MAG TPA: indolepyruvate oxidoreductase subunit beta [Bacillota bacterium]|nr:indolepyruvate oxidoreductase subunit beta [Bacillota bacterium]